MVIFVVSDYSYNLGQSLFFVLAKIHVNLYSHLNVGLNLKIYKMHQLLTFNIKLIT